MKRVGTLAVAGCVVATLAAAPHSPAAEIRNVLAVEPAVYASALRSYPVYDTAGMLLRNDTYRVTMAAGNCCEKYLATTATGTLLELGGSAPYFSTDEGVTWSFAKPPVPMLNGEGAISPTPDGDVVGVAWDAYSGDQLVAYRWEAATNQWLYMPSPLHEPAFDRPWLTVVKGPFHTPAGGTAPWIVLVQGGVVRSGTDLVSYDGLTYTEIEPTSALAAALPAVAGPLPVATDPQTDLLQPNAQSATSPLPGFGAIRRPDSGVGCPTSALSVLQADHTWRCLDMPPPYVNGDVRADSNGWLHNVVYGAKTVTYRVSTDGAATWQSATYNVGATIGTRPDFKVDSARSVAYVALRAGAVTDPQQDLVLKVSIAGGTPSFQEVRHLGLGDVAAVSSFGATAGTRMDFASLAVLPDGRYAVSFLDSTTKWSPTATPVPAIAILQ